jgi:predicted outer membrane repeat protein
MLELQLTISSNSATVKGGAIGGAIGLAVGTAGTFWAARRLPSFTALTPQFRAFLVASTSTFASTFSPSSCRRREKKES